MSPEEEMLKGLSYDLHLHNVIERYTSRGVGAKELYSRQRCNAANSKTGCTRDARDGDRY